MSGSHTEESDGWHRPGGCGAIWGRESSAGVSLEVERNSTGRKRGTAGQRLVSTLWLWSLEKMVMCLCQSSAGDPHVWPICLESGTNDIKHHRLLRIAHFFPSEAVHLVVAKEEKGTSDSLKRKRIP